MKLMLDYVWIDGSLPTPRLRSKTKILEDDPNVPEWSFDGSSTNQADGKNSDCRLVPVKIIADPMRQGRPGMNKIALCEVQTYDGKPAVNNYRSKLAELCNKVEAEEYWFGIEQEYTLFKGHSPLGWPDGGYPPTQGPFYCGVGADETFGREIVETHLLTSIAAGLNIAGINAEVMPGQWEFQIGPLSPLDVCDQILLARYLLYKIAERHGVTVKLDPKPVRDLNGAGAHINFSTKKMRESYNSCIVACQNLGSVVTGIPREHIAEGAVYDTQYFPEEYGADSESRLTGIHETCSYKEFKFGISDRTASIRIPTHVKVNSGGYIEDRRPSANIDPYRAVEYIIKATMDGKT